MTSEPRIAPLVEDANNRFPGGWSLTTIYGAAGTPVGGIIDLGEGWTLTCFDPNPVRVATPPPPPAPPPFEPQPVEITLGTSGDTVTLMTTEGGGFTLDGAAFRSGGRVTSGNGGVYILTLSEGTWTATFDEHEIRVPLGMSGETVTITQAEDGSYWLGEMAVTSGKTVHVASNGNEYILRITTDRSGAVTWMASYRMQMITVMLGQSGETVTIEKAEDGSYRLGGMVVTSGETTAQAGNGNTYRLRMGEDGMWVAEHNGVVVDVTLGASGDTVVLRKAEDGGYWLGEIQVESGVTVATASNGNRYRLRRGADRMWTAEYQPLPGTVTVGRSGVTLDALRAEDGTWTVESPVSGATEKLVDGARFVVGDNTYTLSSDGSGNWMATYREEVIRVMLGTSGETVLLTKREDGSYWLGEMRVENRVTTVTAANGNIYTLRRDTDGTWLAELGDGTSEKVPPSGSTTAAIVTLTNLTPGQVMAPAIVIVHGEDARPVFTPGERASPALVMFAEEDQSAMLLGEAGQDPHVTDARVVLGTGPNGTIGPGRSASLSIAVRPGLDQVTVVASLTSTNDGFVGANGIRVPVSDEVEEFLVAWDAGSEVNDEDCSHIPGPPCGNHVKGVREGAAIVVHSGIHGHGDLAPKTLDWDYPAAKVSIELSGSR